MKTTKLISILTLSAFCAAIAVGCGRKGVKKKRPVNPDTNVERETQTRPPLVGPTSPTAPTELTSPTGEGDKVVPEVVETKCEDKTNPECLTEEERKELEARAERAAADAAERIEEREVPDAVTSPENAKMEALSQFIRSVYANGNLVNSHQPSLRADASIRVVTHSNFKSLRLDKQSLDSYCYRELCAMVSSVPSRMPAAELALPDAALVRFAHRSLWSEIFNSTDSQDVARRGRNFIVLGNSIVGVIVQGKTNEESRLIVDKELVAYDMALGFYPETNHLVVLTSNFRKLELFQRVNADKFERYEVSEPSYSQLGQMKLSYGSVDNIDFVNSVPVGLWDTDLVDYKVAAAQTKFMAARQAAIEAGAGEGDPKEVIEGPREDGELTDGELIDGAAEDDTTRRDEGPDKDAVIPDDDQPDAVETAPDENKDLGRFLVEEEDIKQVQCLPVSFNENNEVRTLRTILNFFPTESFKYPEFAKLDGADVEDLQNELPISKYSDGSQMHAVLKNGKLKLEESNENEFLFSILDSSDGIQGQLKIVKRENGYHFLAKLEGDETFKALAINCLSYTTAARAGYVQHPEVPQDKSANFVVQHRVANHEIRNGERFIFMLVVIMRVLTDKDDPYAVKDGQVFKDGQAYRLESGADVKKDNWAMQIDATGFQKIILPDGSDEAPNGGKITLARPVYSDDENDNDIVFSMDIFGDSESQTDIERIKAGLDLEQVDIDDDQSNLHLKISEAIELCVHKSYAQAQIGVEKPFVRREVLGTCFGNLKIKLPKNSPIEIYRGDKKLHGPTAVTAE